MMQNLMQNPAMMQQMMQSNPMLQQMTQNNPMLAQMMSNPEMMRGAMQMMSNPQMMQSLGGMEGMRGLQAGNPLAALMGGAAEGVEQHTPPSVAANAGPAGGAAGVVNPMAAMMQDPAMMQAA